MTVLEYNLILINYKARFMETLVYLFYLTYNLTQIFSFCRICRHCPQKPSAFALIKF